MAIRLFVLAIVALFAVPVLECEAQKLKLPKFLPFKKQSKEVEPFKLSDNSKSHAGNKQKNKLFDFLQPRAKDNKNTNPFNTKSKEFFSKTNEGLDKFSAKTKKFFGDAWNPPKAHTAWWNQAPDKLDNSDLKELWQKAQRGQGSTQPPTVPAPRSAQHYQYGQPKHRFK